MPELSNVDVAIESLADYRAYGHSEDPTKWADRLAQHLEGTLRYLAGRDPVLADQLDLALETTSVDDEDEDEDE